MPDNERAYSETGPNNAYTEANGGTEHFSRTLCETQKFESLLPIGDTFIIRPAVRLLLCIHNVYTRGRKNTTI